MRLGNDIRQTFRIARIELNMLFYSPVAWLVLVIFAFQTGDRFYDAFGEMLHSMELGHSVWHVTDTAFVNMFTGLFPFIFKNLYLYIPLVTMGVMSREYSSGSIKLLYSSPIRNSSIILGKFLSMVVYDLALCAVIFVPILLCAVTVENFQMPLVLVALLGVFLLGLVYSAIGLFMSSITRYQVVAAVGTFAILAALNFMSEISLNNEFFRDVTYWLSLPGRTYSFREGLLPTDDFAYFIIVTALFLALSIFKLDTQRTVMTGIRKVGGYLCICTAALVLAYATSSPYLKYYYDATYAKSNTLSEESQEIIKNIKGPLKMTTYVNMIGDEYVSALPVNRRYDMERFERYFRFKPDITMDYVFYYHHTENPDLEARFPDMTDKERAVALCDITNLSFDKLLTPEQIDGLIDLRDENYNFVRIVENTEGGSVIMRLFNDNARHPNEEEISAALKRLSSEKTPLVAFIGAEGAREIDNFGSRGYYFFAYDKRFRQSLLNQGFDVRLFDLESEDLTDDVDIVVLTDVSKPLPSVTEKKLEDYISAGGNAFILGDYRRQQNIAPLLSGIGVAISDNLIAKESSYTAPYVIAADITDTADSLGYFYRRESLWGHKIYMPTCLAVDYSQAGQYGFKAESVLETGDAWIEKQSTDLVDGDFTYDESSGEQAGTYSTLVHLSRQIDGKEQRIVVSGDADCISNGELSIRRPGGANYAVITSSFRWLSGDRYPIVTERAKDIDNGINLPLGSRKWVKYFFLGVFPSVLGFAGFRTVSRRRRK